MVSFQDLCDGKIMVRKKIFFGFCVEMPCFFAKNLSASSSIEKKN